ncbi:uncharacterized protein LOC118836889 [Trichosurus vulpecula]|uniref:uncharacterized protein LOC118836889 n=1 Tax=Trichosurus vulpecula TaxID=9337 RepID=UPI00186B34FB|nr:uncharacterized protein LOC118836889 [Trichosurus vulpecula]
MKFIGMETNFVEEKQVPSFSVLAKNTGTSKDTKNGGSDSHVGVPIIPWGSKSHPKDLCSIQQIPKQNESPSTYVQVPGYLSITNEPKNQNFFRDSLYPTSTKAEDYLFPLKICPSLYLPNERSDGKPEIVPEIYVIKQKPSTITFSNNECLTPAIDSDLHICGIIDTETSSYESVEEVEEGDDETFPQLPLFEPFFKDIQTREVPHDKQKALGFMEEKHAFNEGNSYEHLGRVPNKEENKEKAISKVTQPKGSEWSDSMACVMKKLEQLNLDIEEALSAGPSPSHTPSFKRRKQQSSKKVESILNKDHQNKGICRNKEESAQDLDFVPNLMPTGARPKMKVLPDKQLKERAGQHFLYSLQSQRIAQV